MRTTQFAVILSLAGVFWNVSARGQKGPQDNWYHEITFGKVDDPATVGINEASNQPYGVAISDDFRIHVVNGGDDRITIYDQSGNGLAEWGPDIGGGQTLVAPMGIEIGPGGFVYVTDLNLDVIFKLNPDGTYHSTIGSQGTGDGQFQNPYDLAISDQEELFVADTSNYRVQVFDLNGSFLRTWGSQGALAEQFQGPYGIDVSPAGVVFVCDVYGAIDSSYVKSFSPTGEYFHRFMFSDDQLVGSTSYQWGPTAISIGPGGLEFVVRSRWIVFNSPADPLGSATHVYATELNPSGHSEQLSTFNVYSSTQNQFFPCIDLAPDGSFVISNPNGNDLRLYRRAYRTQFHPGKTWSDYIPQPAVIRSEQEQNSPVVNIDYRVTDMDSATADTGLLAFVDGMIDLTHLVQVQTFTEGTGSLVGQNQATNQILNLKWDSGADLGNDLVNYTLAALANDQRPWIDFHFLTIPDANGDPNFVISRSPLDDTDFINVWFWLLAIADPAIRLEQVAGQPGRVFGTATAGTAYEDVLLAEETATTDEGRAYLFERMGVVEATPSQVDFARQATMPPGTSPNQWTPAKSTSGHPQKVNEWGFDTGDYPANSHWWVIKP